MFWPTSCWVRYVICNIMVKIITNLDADGILRGEDHKQAGFQRTGSSSFISDTKILRIDKMSTFDPTRREDFCADTL